ncbi:adenylate/guanylate cyclase domain-containing protein, partial [bacterium]|nr:adenylate/guanylate cyclase domain-containing protein [bacterium]
SAGLIVSTLERLFGGFDEIVQHHGLEKLKTIGDGYMYAGGLFEEGNQVEQSVLAAQEIIAFVKRETRKLKEQTGFEWSLRIGIHTGSTITGIIGKWRFLYDVWGNTVNIAARMEAASESNRINVSKLVHDELQSRFDFEYRGVLPIKNLQPIEMFFVLQGKS